MPAKEPTREEPPIRERSPFTCTHRESYLHVSVDCAQELAALLQKRYAGRGKRASREPPRRPLHARPPRGTPAGGRRRVAGSGRR